MLKYQTWLHDWLVGQLLPSLFCFVFTHPPNTKSPFKKSAEFHLVIPRAVSPLNAHFPAVYFLLLSFRSLCLLLLRYFYFTFLQLLLSGCLASHTLQYRTQYIFLLLLFFLQQNHRHNSQLAGDPITVLTRIFYNYSQLMAYSIPCLGHINTQCFRRKKRRLTNQTFKALSIFKQKTYSPLLPYKYTFVQSTPPEARISILQYYIA